MADQDVSKLTDWMSKTSVENEDIVSFAGKNMKLNKEEDAKEIVDAVLACKNMEALRLEGNTLGVDAAKAISKALEKHPEFKRALWSDMFTGRLKTEIPPALRFLSTGIMLAGAKLVELDLSDNAFGPTGIDGVVELLKSESSFSLQELKLNNNGLGVTGGKILAKTLVDCCKISKAAGNPIQLKVFVSGRGRLENEGSIALAEAFKLMGSLEYVSMPQNGINHPGIAALADAFAVNKNLRELNLNDNTFTEKGAASMAKALSEMQNLEVINFGDCLLRTEGGQLIASALKSGHCKLRELNLGFNEIKKEGAIFVAECMKCKDSLEKLELNGNHLGEEGIESVQESLKSMEKMDILGSMSEDEGSDEGSDNEEYEQDEESDEGIDTTDPNLAVHGSKVTLSPRTDGQIVTAEEYLAAPTESSLLYMGPDRTEAFLQFLGENWKDVDETMNMFIQVSSVVTQENEKVKLAACECADSLFKRLFEDNESEITPSEVTNSLLVHLGLLKSEDKTFNPISNASGPLLVLAHVVTQSYLPKQTRDILQVFLSQPHKSTEICQQAKHKLLQVLYQF